MFFPDRVNPLPDDRVLEVGPGAMPHPRSQTFLDMRFADDDAFRQRGGLPPVEFTKPVIYYDGGKFPFRDREFDYVICSHVLEHAENPEAFLGELGRVAARGYLEFPTILYDYLYNFKEHVNLLLHKEGQILWMPKNKTVLNDFAAIQEFLRATLHSGYHELVQAMKDDFFQGFEWIAPISARKVEDLIELVPSRGQLPLRSDPHPAPTCRELARELVRRLSRRIRRAGK